MADLQTRQLANAWCRVMEKLLNKTEYDIYAM